MAQNLNIERFRTIFDAMLEGVQILDHNWRYLYLNATAAQHNRRPNQELLGQVYMDMWPGIETTAVFTTLKRCMEEHLPAHIENEFVYPDGQRSWFELRIQPIPEGIFILSFDITDRKQAEIALRISQATYQNLFDNNPHPMWVYDAETLAFLMVNDAAIAHYGYSRDEFLGMALKDIRPPEDVPALLANLSQPPVPLEKTHNWRHCKKDGSIINVEIVSHTIQLGERAARLVAVSDVTERRQTEEKLQISEHTLKLFVEYAPAAIAMFDRDMRYIAASRRFIMDYRLGDINIIGRSHYEVFPEISDEIKAIHQRCLAGAIEKEEETPFLRADGSLDWVKWEVHPWYELNGAIGGIILFSEVITEHKEAQLALKANEERLRLILETTSDGFWIVDTQARFLDVNQAYCAMSGFTREELLQLTIMDVEAIETPQDTTERITQIMREGHAQFESRHRRKDGTVFDVDVTVNLLEQEQPLMICFCRDITVRKQAEAMRRKSEALLSEAQRLGHIGHWEWNAPSRDMLCSDELLRILELPHSSHVISQAFFSSMLITDDRQRLHELDKAAFAAHSDLDYEFCIQLVDGRLRWLHQYAQVFYGDDDRPYRMLGIIQDISERKQVEEALRESEEKYRVLIESLDSVVSTVNDEGRFLYMNDVAAQQLQGTAGQFIGKTMHQLFPPEVADYQLGHVRDVIRGGQKMVSEAQSMVQGERRWHKTTIHPIHNAHQQVAYALVHAIDIDDLKTAQQALEELNHTLEERVRERTAQVQDLYDNAPIGYHSLDARGRILMINQTALNWLGYSRDELIGHPFYDLLASPGRESFAVGFAQFQQQGAVNGVELELLRKDGSRLPVLLNAIAIYDAEGQFRQSRATTFDATELRKAERTVRESQDELRLANAELAKAARLKDEFLANMSHELRTPLNSILIFSESLLEQISGPLNEQQQRWVENIESSGRHLLLLINDILDLSKVEAGQMDLQIERVPLAGLCQASLLFVKEMATKKQLQLTFQLNDHLAQVTADPKRLKQILVNLLSNAVKFTPMGGKVKLEVTVDEAAGVVRYEVEDTGIGIAAADLPRLFQPFTQLDSSLSRHHEGTGLGLALVSRLTALHGGSVTVESELGKASRFTVTLPHQPSARPDKTPPEPNRRVVNERHAAQGTRILLAEDNEVNIAAFSDYLTAKGYDLTVARNGRQALELVAEIRPHLILMDIQMPEMDGLQTMVQLRATPEFRLTPLIALTALAMPGDRERCLAAGANEYLTKPISPKRLVEVIQTLLAA